MEHKKIIVDLLSDTHNRHDRIDCGRGGDIILHAGDLSGHGDTHEIVRFLDWYKDQPYTHKVLVPGNHDFGFENGPKECEIMCRSRGIILLNDSGVTLEGIKIWGSPVQPWFHSWAFNRARTLVDATTKHPWIKNHWDLIPEDTEILITHGPPAGVMDMTTFANGDPREAVGCEELAHKLSKTQVKLHVFGHIHEARGIVYSGPRTYVNASFLDRMYMPQAKRPIRAIREVVEDGSIVYLAEE